MFFFQRQFFRHRMNSFERYFLIAGWGGREGIKNGLVEMLPKKHHDEKKELARGEKIME